MMVRIGDNTNNALVSPRAPDAPDRFIRGPGGIGEMTNYGLANLLLVIDRLFIQMNADYRGRFSMLGQLAGQCNE